MSLERLAKLPQNFLCYSRRQPGQAFALAVTRDTRRLVTPRLALAVDASLLLSAHMAVGKALRRAWCRGKHRVWEVVGLG